MRRLKRAAYSLLAFFACLAFQHCANQQPPGGGPRDLAPPTITETEPENGTTNVSPKTITIRFDKYVDKRTVQDALFISPALKHKPVFSWSGKTLEITINDTLRPNTTYNFSFGTDIADLREQVHLAKPFNFTFSTGAVLDTNRIAGKVYCKEPIGTFVFAYSAAGKDLDTLNPTHTKPDYLAAVGKDSSFVVPALPSGTFRLLAIHDDQRNLIYDIGSDGYATARADVSVDSTHPVVKGIIFDLALPEDTIAPQLLNIKPLTNTHLLVGASEPLDSTTITPAHVVVADSTTHALLHIRSIVPSTKKTGLDIYTDSTQPNTTYKLYADSLRDKAGNYMLRDTLEFYSIAARDTSPPAITFPFRDSTVDVSDTALHFIFDEPVQKSAAEGAIYLFDSTRKVMPLHFTWVTDAILLAKPDSLMSNAWYTLVTEAQKFVDLNGNHTKDSLVRIRFRTFDERNFGVLMGTITDTSNAKNSPYVVTLTNVASKKQFIYTLARAGAFTFSSVPDGTYAIEAFRDDNHTGKYFPGSVVPYKFAEPYFLLGETIRVRARWSVQGINIEF